MHIGPMGPKGPGTQADRRRAETAKHAWEQYESKPSIYTYVKCVYVYIYIYIHMLGSFINLSLPIFLLKCPVHKAENNIACNPKR